MSTSQQQMDISLGELAATAAVSGCPIEAVQRMCEASQFTQGLAPEVLIGAVSDSAEGALQQVNTIMGMASDVASTTTGIGEGVLGRGVCAASEDLRSHSSQVVDAVDSLSSCAGAFGALTTGCAEAVGELAADVVGLVRATIAGGIAVAGDAVHEAVSTVTEILEERNCGLENLVDVTASVCAGAAGIGSPDTGVAFSAGLTMTADVSVEFVAGSTRSISMDCQVEEGIGELSRESTEESSPQPGGPDLVDSENKSATLTPVAVIPSDSAGAVGAEGVEGAVAPSAAVAPQEEEIDDEAAGVVLSTPSGEAWNPDIWTTSGTW